MYQITEEQREKLIEFVIAAKLACPEQVCDMVEAAADRAGYEAGIAALDEAKRVDAAEAKALGFNK